MIPFRVSTPSLEGSYEAAKWLKWPVLADEKEFGELFRRLAPCDLVPLTGVVEPDRLLMPSDCFLAEAKRWIERLQQHQAPTMEDLRTVLACALTNDRDAIWLHEVKPERYLVKSKNRSCRSKPIFFPIRSKTKPFIRWCSAKRVSSGASSFPIPKFFSIPIGNTEKSTRRFRTQFFSEIRQWTRDVTRPASFLVDGKKVNVPMRIGKNCLSWIASHPQLKQHNLVYAH